MAVSYNKLWKLLIDKNMKKKELGEAAGISNSLIAKLGKNENVTVDVLVRICTALDCRIEDIMELNRRLPNSQINVCLDMFNQGYNLLF